MKKDSVNNLPLHCNIVKQNVKVTITPKPDIKE